MQQSAWAVIALLAGLGVWLYPLLERHLVGIIPDDGVYLMTALGFAKGLGAHMPHMVTMPPQVRYPWGYPLLLTPLWWLFPNAPGNLGMFSLFTLVCSLLGLGAADAVLKRLFNWPLWTRLLVLLAVGSNYFFIYHSTAVMSEGPYLLVTMLTLLAAHQWKQATQNSTPTKAATRWWVLLVVLGVFGFHIRVFGITLIAAVAVWLCLQGRWLRALGYTALSAMLTVVPWVWWVNTHRMAPLSPNTYPLFGTLSDYMTVFRLDLWRPTEAEMWQVYSTRLQKAGSDTLYALMDLLFPVLMGYLRQVGVAGWVQQHRWYVNVHDGLILLTQFGLALTLLLPLVQSITQWIKAKGQPLVNATPEVRLQWLAGLYVAFYMLLMMGWSFPDQSFRFMIVLLPLLWGLLLRHWPRTKPVLAVGLLALSLVWVGKDYGLVKDMRQHKLLTYNANLRGLYGDYDHFYRHVRTQLPATARIGTSRDIMLYLNTGRQALHVSPEIILKRLPIPASMAALEQLMDKLNVEYVVLEHSITNFTVNQFSYNPAVSFLLNQYPKRYTLVYQSPHEWVALFKRTPFNPLTGALPANVPKGLQAKTPPNMQVKPAHFNLAH
jgi:hypothetical protein